MSQRDLFSFALKLPAGRRIRFAISLTAIFATVCSVATARAGDPATRPNILFVSCDDHAYQAISAYQSVSAYGLKLNETPNIDRLAREGMRFDNCYVTR